MAETDRQRIKVEVRITGTYCGRAKINKQEKILVKPDADDHLMPVSLLALDEADVTFLIDPEPDGDGHED